MVNWKDISGEKLIHAMVGKTSKGDIEGQGNSHSLTTDNDQGYASCVGLDK